MRNVLKDGGWTEKVDNRESGGSALVGYQGRLFQIQTDMSIVEPDPPLWAVGSGYEFALGAMHYARTLGRKPTTTLTAGLEAAAAYNPYVMPPFHIREAK